eukprot:7162953-Pyramimonas_sp.AAC.1
MFPVSHTYSPSCSDRVSDTANRLLRQSRRSPHESSVAPGLDHCLDAGEKEEKYGASRHRGACWEAHA